MPPTPTPMSRRTKTASLSSFHPFLTHTTERPPLEPRTIALAQSPPRTPREWTADQRGDRGGLRPLPHPVSTRSQDLFARGKPRIPLVGVALGAGAHRAAVPPSSRRRRRGRGCAAAAARRFRRTRAHTREASVREVAWGAPDWRFLPHRPAGRPLRARPTGKISRISSHFEKRRSDTHRRNICVCRLELDTPYSGRGGHPVVRDPGKKPDLVALWLAHNAPHFTVGPHLIGPLTL